MKIQSNSAFSLVEVTLALGICAFCLISLVGLIPTGISATNNASREAVATNIATSILADLQGMNFAASSPTPEDTPSKPSKTKLFEIPCTAELNKSNFIPVSSASEQWIATSGDGQFGVITRISPNPASSNGPFAFTVEVYWPGSNATNMKKQGSVTVFGRTR